MIEVRKNKWEPGTRDEDFGEVKIYQIISNYKDYMQLKLEDSTIFIS